MPSEQSPKEVDRTSYELPYDEQPEGVWMKCPWADDPEEGEHKKGDYAKKCPCPNCVYHKFADKPPSESSERGVLKRAYLWLTGGESDYCRMCSDHNCTEEESDCGAMGRVESISLTDDDQVKLNFHNDNRQ